MSELPSNIHLDPSVDTEGERFERGLETIARFGVMSGAKPFEAISKIAPDFVRYTMSSHTGTLHRRTSIGLQDSPSGRHCSAGRAGAGSCSPTTQHQCGSPPRAEQG